MKDYQKQKATDDIKYLLSSLSNHRLRQFKDEILDIIELVCTVHHSYCTMDRSLSPKTRDDAVQMAKLTAPVCKLFGQMRVKLLFDGLSECANRDLMACLQSIEMSAIFGLTRATLLLYPTKEGAMPQHGDVYIGRLEADGIV